MKNKSISAGAQAFLGRVQLVCMMAIMAICFTFKSLGVDDPLPDPLTLTTDLRSKFITVMTLGLAILGVFGVVAIVRKVMGKIGART